MVSEVSAGSGGNVNAAVRFFRSSNDGLPFLVREAGASQRTMRLSRSWRSLPRLVRSLLLMLVVVCLLWLGGAYAFSSSSSSPSDNFHKSGDIAHREAQSVIDNGKKVADEKKKLIEKTVKSEESFVNNAEDKGARVIIPRPKGPPVFAGPSNDRQKAVVNAFRHAWKGYKKHAWGHDQLKPISGGYSDWFDVGLTMVDGLDTAIIMGLKEEVKEATEWIRSSLSFEKDRFVNLFETTIRVLGGLLSAFHLTGNQVFVDRAEDLGGRLLGAWSHSKSPIPLSDVNLKTRSAKSPAWGSESSLSEVTTVQLEFRDLARITGNATFEEMTFNTSKHIHQLGCADQEGLCDMFVNANTGRFKDHTTITFGARSDSYYEYLLKQWLQTGKTIDWLFADYKEAMSSMKKKLWKESEPNKLAFVGELISGSSFSPKMDHLVCFLAGTLALGTMHGSPPEHLEWGKVLGETCGKAFYDTASGLAPEIVHFNLDISKEADVIIKPLDSHCLLRPEAIEAWFYLYRITGDKKFQEFGWKAFEAIEKYAKIAEGGYSSVNNVKTKNVTYRDLMESFYLAETLKYLYLLFDDDQTILPLDKWIFNTEGHPLPFRDS